MAPDYAPVDGQAEFVPIGYIPQVPQTWAYWDTDYGVQNERGLSIGESTCTARTVGWPATPDKPWGYNKAGIEDLSKIALERCETARCAVKTMGAIAVEQGFYSADSGEPSKPGYGDSSEALTIADPTPGEVWVFHVLTGRGNASAIWAAQRIPPNHIAAIGNAFTIRKMNLSDSANFMYSDGITEVAEEQGWWKPEDEDSPDTFDFFGAYGYTPEKDNERMIDEFYSGRRMWRVWNLLTPQESHKLDPNKGQLPHTKDPYPISMPAPRHSVTLQMVMDTHRDHYEGTPYDLTVGMAAGQGGSPNRGNNPRNVTGGWERAISMHRTTFSFVTEAKPTGRAITWFGYDAPHGTAYLPFFGAATEGAPAAWHSHDGYQSKFSMKVAWWAFNIINQYSDLNFRVINPEVKTKAHKIEAHAMELVAQWEKQAANLSEDDAMVFLTQRSNDFATATLQEWWDFAGHLWAKFGRYVVTYNETEHGTDALGQAYPEWWLRNPDVGFTTWARDGPHVAVSKGWDPSQVLTPGWSNGFLAVCVIDVVVLLLLVVRQAYRAGVRKGGREAKEELGYCAEP
jgi:dipeptidase